MMTVGHEGETWTHRPVPALREFPYGRKDGPQWPVGNGRGWREGSSGERS